jgi:protein involved in polysaccharide export with SLBB domain
LTRTLTKDTNAPAGQEVSQSKLPSLTGGEIIIVPESLDRFAILGYVTKPGFYPMPSGRKYTLSEALALAEGADKRGRLSKVGLVRLENGKEVRKIYDVGKYLRSGDVAQNPEIMPGDVVFVPETDRVDISTALSGITSFGILMNAFRR